MPDTNGNGIQGRRLAINRLTEYVTNAIDRLEFQLRRRGEGGGGSFEEISKECGFPIDVTAEACRDLIERGDVAARVNQIYPEETWAEDPLVYEDEEQRDTPFDQALQEIQDRLGLWSYLERLDEQAGVGHFGAMLYGFGDKQPLNVPVAGINERGEKVGSPTCNLNYLRVFDETLASVTEFERDPDSPRYMQPTEYALTIATVPEGEVLTSGLGLGSSRVAVHWTRIHHFADGVSTSETFGRPRLKQVFNRLLGVQRIAGGDPQMYWKGALPPLSAEFDPAIDVDVEATRDEVDRLMRGLQRFVLLQGGKLNSLAPTVADPKEHVLVQMQLIALTIGVPLRVLMGTEEGKLAGGQDKDAWRGRVQRRRNKLATPKNIRPCIDRLVMVGCLPTPKKGPTAYKCEWPDPFTPSDQDKATVAETRTNALAKYVSGGVESIIPPLEYLTGILGMELDEAEAILEAAMEAISDPKNPVPPPPPTPLPGQQVPAGAEPVPPVPPVPAVANEFASDEQRNAFFGLLRAAGGMESSADKGGGGTSPGRQALHDLIRRSADAPGDAGPDVGLIDKSAAEKLGDLVRRHDAGKTPPLHEVLMQVHKAGSGQYPTEESHREANAALHEMLNKASDAAVEKAVKSGEASFYNRPAGGAVSGGTYPSFLDHATPGYARFLRERLKAKPS